jgi:hypothetical protein
MKDPIFDQITTNLERGKDNYRSTLRATDSALRNIVSQDPSQLAAARAVQASYGEGFEGADLAAAEQPAAPKAPKAKAKRARKTAAAAGKAKRKK